MKWMALAKEIGIPVAKAAGEALLRWIKGEGRNKIDDMLNLQRKRLRKAIDIAESEGDWEAAAKLSDKLAKVENALRRRQ